MTRVLVVDDHPSFRASVRLLLDVQLAESDGFALARRLCAERRPPRVVLVSSRDESDYGHLVGDCGAIGFISKGDLTGTALAALLA